MNVGAAVALAAAGALLYVLGSLMLLGEVGEEHSPRGRAGTAISLSGAAMIGVALFLT